jgi:hypothetical protein
MPTDIVRRHNGSNEYGTKKAMALIATKAPDDENLAPGHESVAVSEIAAPVCKKSLTAVRYPFTR